MQRSGFTLLEIVLVVAIVAILVTLAAPTFQKPRAAAQQTAAKLELLDLMAAQRLHHLRHQTYTQTLDDLPDIGTRRADEHGYTFEARACPPDLKHCVRIVASPPASGGESLTLDSNGAGAW